MGLVDEVTPQGGSWSGMLFENPGIGYGPALHWTFEFELGEVRRDHGETDVSLTVDWVPLPGAAWDAMKGREAACSVFGEPVECSAYFFEHHRYGEVRLRVLDQDGGRIRVALDASGDVDGLGVPRWQLDEWLEFGGIAVDVGSEVRTLEDAEAMLSALTGIGGLRGRGAAGSFRFRVPHPRERS